MSAASGNLTSATLLMHLPKTNLIHRNGAGGLRLCSRDRAPSSIKSSLHMGLARSGGGIHFTSNKAVLKPLIGETALEVAIKAEHFDCALLLSKVTAQQIQRKNIQLDPAQRPSQRSVGIASRTCCLS